MTLRARCQVGLDFFEFLNETNRASITEKVELRDIYNTEFRSRTSGAKDPNFGSVLYALKAYNKVTRRRETIRFNSKVGMPTIFYTSLQVNKQLQIMYVNKKDLNVFEIFYYKDLFKYQNEKTFRVTENNETGWHSLKVRNTGTEPIHFIYYTPLHWASFLKLFDEHRVTKVNPLLLQPGDSYEIQVLFSCSFVGIFPATLAFEFKPDSLSSNSFHIVRYIEAKCVTSLGRLLEPVTPYKARSVYALTADLKCQIVDGQPPDGYDPYLVESVITLKNDVQLKQYRVPAYVNQLIKSLKQPHHSDSRRTLLESPLSWENYTEKFQLLLYLEESQMNLDIKRYNIPNEDSKFAVLKRDKNKKLLVLEVPGVSENRPSVLRGDSLLVQPQGEKEVKYRGYVHSVNLDSVKLGKDLSIIEGIKFNVEFTINRLTIRLQHRAAEFATLFGLRSVLFPDETPSHLKPELPHLKLFDQQLERNPEQYQAVQQIVAGSSRPAPYLIFGPPGTGKTVTVVEAIKQIEKTQASCHILACAPSNSAADLLCSKIRDHVDECMVYRMYASSRDPKLVPAHLKGCSNLVGESYVYPAKEKLMEYKIIVTTLLSAGRLVSGNIPSGHFTHVFVDEAGHAVETECVVPLAGLLDAESGQLVLAGDPKQLGPILRSPFSLKYGMGVSLLERLMTTSSLYQKNEGVYNNCFVTKLLRNYRSHPAILKIPNELFYDGELQACADEYACNFYRWWQYLPKQDLPLIFHGVAGEDTRESNSPSFFNVAEVEVLMDYVRKLLQSGRKKGLATIGPKDIGIIAPYRKQVQKIRKALEQVGKEFTFTDMNVGSVEEFQGQERRVIMVSTVRSSSKYMDYDKKFSLGFVKNEKRFNVAVTRAKALLIVVGNPIVLNTDDTWKRFIQYCKDEGGCTGLVQPEKDDYEVVLRLSALYISIEGHDKTYEKVVEMHESVVQQQLDPEWRNDL
uniref:RNA helicase n=1 Tax=Nothobranchius furzeri TaxID=105023 RepID=A0A8C6P323_NOTFU